MDITILAYIFCFSSLLFTTALIMFSWFCDEGFKDKKRIKWTLIVLGVTFIFSVISCSMANMSFTGFTATEELNYTDRVAARYKLLPLDDGDYVKFEQQNKETVYIIKEDKPGWDFWNHEEKEPTESRMVINQATWFYFGSNDNYVEYKYMYKQWLCFRKYYLYKVIYLVHK